MNMIEFRGAIYRTEYAMICQPMTRIDTPIAVCFLLLLFAVETPIEQENYVQRRNDFNLFAKLFYKLFCGYFEL